MGNHSNLLGGAIACAVAILSNYGVNVQKQLHRRLESQGHWDISYTHHWIWWWGMVLIGIGSIGDLIAFSFARAAVVAAVGGVTTIVANVGFAQCMNQEPLHTTDAVGIACLIAAVVILAMISHDEAQYDVEQLSQLFTSQIYLLYVAIQIILLIGLGARIFETQRNGVKSICFAAMSGTIGAMSVLLGKCTMEMISQTIDGSYFAFTHAYFYAIALALVICVASQTHCLNRSFSTGDIMSSLPVFQMFWIGFAVVGDIVFYHTFTAFNLWQWIVYLLVLLLMILGCFCVAITRLQTAYHDDFYTKVEDNNNTAMLKEVFI
ncbi:hypothetical protein THRCLA_11624 [Thraustotheca clavata]|uniref:Magnesium transporter n=1 Tax=Thraustotheca clavata TaxID=74557 RepID=A0A1V9Y743_9STRA|nr:hypothetical protein THRCLA_11624 [Thraustotheca clavata]